MRVLMLLALIFSSSLHVFAQDREKDDYAILEVVIRKENAIKLHHVVYNGGLLHATDSLTSFTGVAEGNLANLDSIIRWDDATRSQYLQQLAAPPRATWEKRKVFFCTVVEEDVIADAAKGNTASLNGNKTRQILRVSQPLYQGATSAIVYAEFEMMGVVNGSVTYRKMRKGIYFLKSEKGKWKIRRYVGKLLN